MASANNVEFLTTQIAAWAPVRTANPKMGQAAAFNV
jgi:hypothetical protein